MHVGSTGADRRPIGGTGDDDRRSGCGESNARGRGVARRARSTPGHVCPDHDWLGGLAQRPHGAADDRARQPDSQADSQPDEEGSGRSGASGEPIAIVLEPTGGYELAFALWARQQPGWQAHRPNPARVRAWARSQGGRAKTDRQDALLLARFGASAQPALPVWQPLASEVGELAQLLRRRDEVKDGLERERRRQEQLGVRSDASTTVRASVERLLKTLQDELDDLEHAIAEQVQQHATLRTNKQRLLTVPGVGPRVALPLLMACERSHALAGAQGTAKGVVAYVGLDPQPHESGASVWQRARISPQGDRRVRARLDMGA